MSQPRLRERGEGWSASNITAGTPGYGGVIPLRPAMPMDNRQRTPAPTTHTRPRRYPDHMYVDVPTVVRRLSGSVALLCTFSFVLSILTGFTIVQRFASVVITVAAIGFYLIAELIGRHHRNK